jgi:hypothetical protein
MIDRTALLATLRPLVVELEDSIRSRVLETPEVVEHLEREHDGAVAAERTAMSLEEWRDGEITQAAVAWILACVFVRFLEDNGLIDQALISGPGGRRAVAVGHREEYFRAHPSHSDREYLEECFREVSQYPAVGPLYDERHNPLWRLGPTADGARTTRETFTAIEPATGALIHDFTDAELDTRFLGDLYQDLSEAAKKRYALLQTPEFVERFILDRTLDPAIGEFGLDEVRLIDPTCGSGHFLIGAFERLFVLWQEREPASTASVLAQRCLDQIAGVDLNPYATAIARFRVIIAALRACGIARLAEAPALRLHVATGDSLLHGPLPADSATMLFDANRLKQNVAHVYESEDAAELKAILGRGYHAVVGNPPYIAVQDAALRDAYRVRYASCHGHYVLTVPFMERFFELAEMADHDGGKRSGFVGKITGNNFMKREFGAPLVERFLASMDVRAVVDASGAYVPGHGTPTILLFGRSRPPIGSTLRVVDGIRGEPGQPEDPAEGQVWSAIVSLIDQPGRQNEFVRSGDVERSELLVHPMILGIGRSLKKAIEAERKRLETEIVDSGFGAVTREDDLYELPAYVAAAHRIPARETTALVSGDEVRDWWISTQSGSLWPYDIATLAASASESLVRFVWPWKRQLSDRVAFGRTQLARGLQWFEYSMFFDRRYTRPTIAWGEVSTHNHFVLDRGGKVFKQTAPLLKLPPDADDRKHLSLLGVLNSSVACFWMKQVCHNKGAGGGKRVEAGFAALGADEWENHFALNATSIKDLPLPAQRSHVLAAALDRLAAAQGALLNGLAGNPSESSLASSLALLHDRDADLARRLVSLQEELDWQVLSAYGLVPEELPILAEGAPPISLGQRAFEIVLARQIESGATETSWFARHGSVAITDVPPEWPVKYRDVVERRIALIESDTDIGLIERAPHKRRWNRARWEDRERAALTSLVLDALDDTEAWADLRPRSTNELTDELRRRPLLVEALELLAERKDADLGAALRRLVVEAAVPHLPAQRLTEKGLRKREVWDQVWEQQRAEDRGEEVGTIPLPPRYAQADFRNGIYWKHRGKLDVPKERFVLIPNAERGADISPVVGWAGWNERDLARALAGRVTELRQEDAAESERLVPLLAGVLELLPWIHQWHPDSDPLFGGPPGTFFETWLDGELASLGVTRESLRAWRPPTLTRGRKATASTT